MQTYIVSLQKIVCEKGDTLKLAGRAGSIEGCGAAAERGGGLLHGGGGEGGRGGGRRLGGGEEAICLGQRPGIKPMSGSHYRSL